MLNSFYLTVGSICEEGLTAWRFGFWGGRVEYKENYLFSNKVKQVQKEKKNVQ